jgi:putative membrane protein
MDHYGYDRWDGGHPWVWMLLMMLALVAALTIAAYVLIRSARQQPQPPPPPPDEAARILDERFARGEIDAEEYATRRDLLRAR